MMVLANSGLRASTIGTGLRQVFARLVAPSAKLREAFAEHNIELEDLSVEVHGFTGVMRNLSDVFVDAETGAIDAQKAFTLFGLRGANSILALMRGINSGEFQTALDHVYEVGTAANMAGIQIEGLALQFKNLQDRFKSLVVELGQRGFVDVLQGFLEVLRQAIIALTAFVEDGMGGAITVYATFIIATGAATVAVMALGKALIFVARKLAILSVGLLSHPIGVMIFAVGALTAAYKRYQNQLTESLHAYQKEVILGHKRIDVLQSYQKRLKDAHEAAKRDQSQMRKYTSLVERLKTEFKDLSSEIEGTGGEFNELNRILKEKAFYEWINTVGASMDALDEHRRVLDKTKAQEGWWVKAKGWIRDFRDEVKTATEFSYKQSMKMNYGFRTTVQIMNELSKVTAPVGQRISEYFSDAHDSAKELGEETKRTKEAQRAFDQAVVETSTNIFFGYQRGIVTMEEMSEHVRMLAVSHGDMSEMMEVYYEALKRAVTLAREWDALQSKKPVTYAKMESPFEKMITEAKGYRQVELLNIKRQMDQEITAYKDKAKKKGIITEESEKNIAAIRMKYLLLAFDVMDDEDDIISARYDKEIAYLEEHKNKYIAYYDEIIAAERATLEENRAIYEENSAQRIKIEKDAADAIKGYQLAKVGVVEGIQQQITDITKKAVKERLSFEVKTETRDVTVDAAKQLAVINEMASSRVISERKAQSQIAKLNEDTARRIYEIESNRFELVKKYYKENEVAYQEAFDAQLEAYMNYLEATSELQDDDKQNFMEMFEEKFALADEYYRSREISEQQYFDWLQLAREEDLISEEEYYARKTIIGGTHFAALKRGIRDVRRQIKTFSEMFYDIATTLPEMFATGFTDAFMEVVEGSKSFGEAMTDLFKNILAYIGQTIMQLLIMKAIMSLMGSLFPGVDALSGGGVGHTEVTMPDFHKGGVPGVDPVPATHLVDPAIFKNARRLHDGLKSDEFPAILKKKEGVFTEGQMKALGQRMDEGAGTSINVPVNVEYTSPRFANALRSNIEEAVKKTLRQELR
jgi:hypothetical protein